MPRCDPRSLPRLLAPRLPFYYGWVVLGCLCLAGFARQGPAVAVLSVFVVPMTEAFGWSRMEIAGAVSLGGLLAAFVSPMLGPVLDRRGARLILCLAVLGTGLVDHGAVADAVAVVFYLLFCFARMVWAGPFDLGLYGALNNWFVAAAYPRHLDRDPGADVGAGRDADDRPARDAATAAGARLDRGRHDGAGRGLPAGLAVPGAPAGGSRPGAGSMSSPGAKAAAPEPRFSRAEAMRTRAFWLLSLYTVLVYPVQAGVSLHQAAHLIERGLTPIAAATVISFFSAMSAVASFGVGFLPRRWPLRYVMLARR